MIHSGRQSSKIGVSGERGGEKGGKRGGGGSGESGRGGGGEGERGEERRGREGEGGRGRKRGENERKVNKKSAGKFFFGEGS